MCLFLLAQLTNPVSGSISSWHHHFLHSHGFLVPMAKHVLPQRGQGKPEGGIMGPIPQILTLWWDDPETASILALRNPKGTEPHCQEPSHITSGPAPSPPLSQLLAHLLVLLGITGRGLLQGLPAGYPNLSPLYEPYLFTLLLLTRHKWLKRRDCSTSPCYPQCFILCLEQKYSVNICWRNEWTRIGSKDDPNNIIPILLSSSLPSLTIRNKEFGLGP